MRLDRVCESHAQVFVNPGSQPQDCRHSMAVLPPLTTRKLPTSGHVPGLVPGASVIEMPHHSGGPSPADMSSSSTIGNPAVPFSCFPCTRSHLAAAIRCTFCSRRTHPCPACGGPRPPHIPVVVMVAAGAIIHPSPKISDRASANCPREPMRNDRGHRLGTRIPHRTAFPIHMQRHAQRPEKGK